MAQFVSILGTITGKLDNLSMRNWQGINVMARQPQGYTDANTVVQQDNRLAFALVAKLASSANTVIRETFARFRNKTTPFAQFNKVNYATMKLALTDLTVLQQNLKFSIGGLVGFEGLSVALLPGNNGVRLTWTNNSAALGASGLDRVGIVAWSPIYNSQPLTKENPVIVLASNLNAATRAAGTVDFIFDALSTNPAEFIITCFLSKPDGTDFSNSQTANYA